MSQEPLSFESLAARAERAGEIMDGFRCLMCQNPIEKHADNPDGVYVEVASLVTGAKLQSPVLRRQTGRAAHAECVRKVLDGEAADQEAIPGLEEV